MSLVFQFRLIVFDIVAYVLLEVHYVFQVPVVFRHQLIPVQEVCFFLTVFSYFFD